MSESVNYPDNRCVYIYTFHFIYVYMCAHIYGNINSIYIYIYTYIDIGGSIYIINLIVFVALNITKLYHNENPL